MSDSNATGAAAAVPASSRVRRRRKPCTRCSNLAQARGLCSYHYAKQRKQQRANGTFRSAYVSNAATLQHIAALRAAGVGWPRMAELAGLSRMTLDHLTDPRRRRVNRRTEAAILAVPIPVAHDPAVAGGAKISIVGSRRRLRALARAGYSQDDIARYLGMTPGSMSKLYSGSQQLITARNARRIAAAFVELQLIPGTSSRAARHAARKSWPPPLAWDEDTIDHPGAQPAPPMRTVRPMGRGLAIPEDFADMVADHRELGRGDNEIAQRLGIKLDTLHSRMRRMERRAS